MSASFSDSPVLGKYMGELKTPPQIAQHEVAGRVAFIMGELDDLISMTRDYGAPDLQVAIAAETSTFNSYGPLATRLRLLEAFVESQKPTPQFVQHRPQTHTR